MRHIEQLSLMVEAVNRITIGNVFVVEIIKQENQCLVEKIIMEWTVVRDVMRF
jgi:hypothetical protein